MVKAAKKRKKDEDEDVSIPEFDEVAYMRKEMNAAQASFVLIGLAVLVAGFLYGITVAGAPIVAFFLGLGITFLLPRVFKFLPWPKVDVSRFERRDWLSHSGTFFFSWLAFWILFLNVPFVDVTPPTIASVAVNGLPITGGSEQNLKKVGDPVFLNATVLENGELSNVDLVLTNATFSFVPIGGAGWSLRLLPASAFNNATIVATDTGGRSAEFSFNLILT